MKEKEIKETKKKMAIEKIKKAQEDADQKVKTVQEETAKKVAEAKEKA